MEKKKQENQQTPEQKKEAEDKKKSNYQALRDDKNGLKSIGMDCDRATWIKFFEELDKEMKRRTESEY